MTPDDQNEELREFVRELTDIQPALRSFVRYLMGGAGDARDVFQEVNLLLWMKRGDFTLGTNFRAWAFTSARYVVLGQRRQLRKAGLLLFEPDLVELLADEWEAEPDEHERKLAALETCLEKLSDADLALLRARYGRHGEVEKMATACERSGGGLRARLFRLRAALKQCVEREMEIERGMA